MARAQGAGLGILLVCALLEPGAGADPSPAATTTAVSPAASPAATTTAVSPAASPGADARPAASPAATTTRASSFDCTLEERPGAQSSAAGLEQWCKADRTQWTAEKQLVKMREDEANMEKSYEQLADITSQQSQVEAQIEEAKTMLKYMKFVPSQQGSIQQKKTDLAALQSQHNKIHMKLAEQTDLTMQSVRALQNNKKCYRLLKNFESLYKSSYTAWKPAFEAYSKDPSSKLGDFWTSTRALADVAHDLSTTQEECAELVDGVDVKIFPRPATCDSDTGGTCGALACHASRAATCVDQKCVCPPGFCSSNGACLPRADPIKLLADGQAARVGVHGDTLALAGLAALVAAVAVAARRGFGREVRLAEQCLG